MHAAPIHHACVTRHARAPTMRLVLPLCTSCRSTSFPHHTTAVEGHDMLVAKDLGLLDKYWVDNWAQVGVGSS